MAQTALIAARALRGPRRAAWIVFSVTVLLALADVALAIFEPEETLALGKRRVGVGPIAFEAVVVGAFGLLGTVVASRQPRNPVGWLLALIGLSIGALAVTNDGTWHLLASGGDAAGAATYTAWLHNWLWIPIAYPALTLLPLLFPTGRPPSHRWRWLVWSALVASALTFAGLAVKPGPFAEHPAIVNPTGIDGPAVEIAAATGSALFVLTALGSIASLVVRFRRARGTERQQIRWVAVGGAVLCICLGAGIVIGFEGREGLLSFAILLLGLLGLAATIAVAMLRYRLYDIDVVINRALVYGALTAMLAVTYLASVLLLQLVLSGVTANSSLAVAASTLAVAALFQPARARIQQTVDRRFYRRKYDAQRTLEAFAARLRDEVALDALSSEVCAVVADTMHPAHVSLWLAAADGPAAGARSAGRAGARS